MLTARSKTSNGVVADDVRRRIPWKIAISCPPRYLGGYFLIGLFLLLSASTGLAQDNSATIRPLFLGAQSCASAMCHGGAGEQRGQLQTWTKLDFHTRARATLTTARSARLAESLKLGNAVESSRCTVCHAPFHDVPIARKSTNVTHLETFTCEVCHGPAENWLRSHTRPDFTHTDRVAAGMRDLRNLYTRANTCVACHQNVDADLLAAGHPELIFELDGQAVTEPRHWRERIEGSGPRAWLIGQTVALREMSWQLEREAAPSENLRARWEGLRWLLEKAAAKEKTGAPPVDGFARVREWSDQLARAISEREWPANQTRETLLKLAGTQEDFLLPKLAPAVQARRAERLVLALDRLMATLEEKADLKPASEKLNGLFREVQSLPDFDAAKFAARLRDFHTVLQQIFPDQQ